MAIEGVIRSMARTL